MVDLRLEDNHLVNKITGRHTCASCSEGHHVTFKRPKVEGICDNCGASKFEKRADDNAETVKNVWLLTTLKPHLFCHNLTPNTG